MDSFFFTTFVNMSILVGLIIFVYGIGVFLYTLLKITYFSDDGLTDKYYHHKLITHNVIVLILLILYLKFGY